MINNKISVLAAILLISSAVFAGDGTTGTYGGESVTHVNSPHNLGGTVGGDNGETCVYCHTPHAANVAFTGAPIWNKAAGSGVAAVFTMYGASATNTAGVTVAGTATDATPASPSLACLSCHDGVSAIDSILNAPGSGMNTIAGSTDINGITSVNGGNIGGVLGTTTTGSVDLTNDHPISIVYDDTKASLRGTGAVLVPDGDSIAWRTNGAVAEVGSLLRNSKVECSSCHDPHNATGMTQALSKQVNFLRVSNENSGLCFGCHAK